MKRPMSSRSHCQCFAGIYHPAFFSEHHFIFVKPKIIKLSYLLKHSTAILRNVSGLIYFCNK